jgi:hypothetical protein
MSQILVDEFSMTISEAGVANAHTCWRPTTRDKMDRSDEIGAAPSTLSVACRESEREVPGTEQRVSARNGE